MIDREVLKSGFADFNLQVSDDVIDKCVELCLRYSIDETELIEDWVAYTTNSGENVDPSVDGLTTMEKKVLSKNQAANKSKRTHYNNSALSSETFIQERDSILISDYPDTGTVDFPSTPELKRKNLPSYGNIVHSPRMGFSPFSMSPAIRETSKGYLQRENSGQIVCSYGERDNLSWTTSKHFTPKLQFSDDFCPMNNQVRYMYSTLLDKIQASSQQAESICSSIMQNHTIKVPIELHHITMETSLFAGKVICDSHGRLNSSSVLLESVLYHKRGENVRLQLIDVPEYSLFPGQCVVVEGKNPDGTKIIAEKIYTDANPPMYSPLTASSNLKESLQLVVACGPYMLANGSYKPFEDLLEYTVNNKPHVLILIGPLIDTNHPDVMSGQFIETFKECCKKLVDSLTDGLASSHTKIILTSSWREAFLHFIYPTPPLTTKVKHPENIFMAPDPSIINISGFHIGLTATDIIMHLGKEELFCSTLGVGTQRLSRIASHLFQQKCFYPLRPPNEEMSIDPSLLANYALIPKKPHMMIIPSDLKSFVNVISDSVFVNPERLTKGTVGGNFARIQVKPAVDSEEWSPATHISVEVVKL